jgi:hypothetical protein
MLGKIEIVVISVEGSKCLPDLKKSLEKIGVKARVLSATTPASSDFISLENIKLSPVEIATSISHQRARKFALEIGCEWAVILEDDAQIIDGFENIETLIEQIEMNLGLESALAVHLYPEQFGILTSNSKESFYRILSLPDCAVGYAMNKLALRATMSIQGIENEVADWHKEIRKISWFAPKSSLVTHPDVSNSNIRSLTSDPRKNRVNQRTLIEKIASYPILKMFLLRFFMPYSSSYGQNPISSEKLRTKVFKTYRIRFRGE